MSDRTMLLRNAAVLVTLDAERREIRDGGVFVRGNLIEAVGASAELPVTADTVIDARGRIVLPGFVNTHHHMYQTLTRAWPGAQDATLFGWLRALYPVWARLTPEMIHASALTAMAELLQSGCTTSSDHLYLFPNGARLEDTIEAAAKIGMRFHATRGAMSVGESQGGLPPDALVEREDEILRDTQRVIEAWHDPRHGSMIRIGVAPCSPFSVSTALMRESAALARACGVRLHTHLAENLDDVAYSRERFGLTPAQFAESLGWTGHDVWHAHCVQLDADGIALFGRTSTGVAHCPSSNMRLASGIAPVRAMRDAHVPVGLGVDGSASNDSSHVLAEARQAMLLARLRGDPAALGAREALELATLGGAQVLGRDDIGSIAPGMAADIVAFDLDQLGFAGALHDPVAALVFCTPANASMVIVNGREVIRDGRLLTLELRTIVRRHNDLARALALG